MHCFNLKSIELIENAPNGSIITTCKGTYLKAGKYLVHIENGQVGDWTDAHDAGKVTHIWSPRPNNDEGPCLAALKCHAKTDETKVDDQGECERTYY